MTRLGSTSEDYRVRGWCPTVRRPMATGDGLIVRLNTQRRLLAPDDLVALAAISDDHGNGLIDLTRRANLQIRGAAENALPAVWHELEAAGLLPEDEASTHNILLAPLAGAGDGEVTPTRPLAVALASALSMRLGAHGLPDKFSFVVDGGGLLSLGDIAADIRLRAYRDEHDQVVVAIGADTPLGTHWLGATTPDDAAATAAAIAAGFMEHRSASQRHMRDLSVDTLDQIASRCTAWHIEALPTLSDRACVHPLGIVRNQAGRVVAAGVAAAFGRMTSRHLRHLAQAAADTGIAALSVSPWRSLYALTHDEKLAAAFSASATALGLLIDENHSLLSIDACPGAPSCASSSVDTHQAARTLAPQLARLGIHSCHVSGCNKGCARSKAADVTLVGTGGTFALVNHGTARDKPVRTLTLRDLASMQHL